MSTRRIITIDRSRCNGCGQCVTACVEGAIEVVAGKAVLRDERYCDGLGACIGHCPTGAIAIEIRQTAGFDGMASLCPGLAGIGSPSPAGRSGLRNWPIQLGLVGPNARFLDGSDLLLAADCVGYAMADLRQGLGSGKAILICCPKLDDRKLHLARLEVILGNTSPASITVACMEVPCCAGLSMLTASALRQAGRDRSFQEVTVGLDGKVVRTRQVRPMAEEVS